MRKTSLVLVCICHAFIVLSQVTEDFETWNTNPESLQPYRWQAPDSWSTSNNVTEFIEHSVLQSSDSYEGQYAALLRSTLIFGQLRPGIIFYGSAEYSYATLNLLPKEGIPMPSQRMRITGWYKYLSVSRTNNGVCVMNLVRINPSSGETIMIAQFQKTLPPVNEYTEFEYFVNAGTSFNASTDRLQILFFSNAHGDLPVKSELWIDEVEITSAVAANAGVNTTLCVDIESGLEAFSLGYAPTANGGTGPYSYTWMTNYYSDGKHYSASDFLDDTTSANPLLTAYVDTMLMFYLSVTDSHGNIAEDSINISFSTWTKTADDKSCHLDPGESCQLYTSVSGGIEPHQYLWSPADGLSDAVDLFAIASPQITTTYMLLITDAAGCAARDTFYVLVSPSSTDDDAAATMTSVVYPNPVVDQSILTALNPRHQALSLVIYNSSGQIVKHVQCFEDSFILYRKDFSRGLYYYQIHETGIHISAGEFLVK